MFSLLARPTSNFFEWWSSFDSSQSTNQPPFAPGGREELGVQEAARTPPAVAVRDRVHHVDGVGDRLSEEDVAHLPAAPAGSWSEGA